MAFREANDGPSGSDDSDGSRRGALRMIRDKGAVPYSATPPLDQGAAWDANAAEASLRTWASKDGSGSKDSMDWAKYQRGFAWYDSANPKDFGSYKLVHHQVEGDELKVNFRGTAAAIAVLNGGRGGVDIPEADKVAVYNHLAKHYSQFGQEPPALKKDASFVGVGVKALSAGGHIKAAAELEPGDLDIINGYALVPLKPSDVSVYTMRVANDQIDRDNERFAPEVLASFAKSLVGKGLLEGHDWGPVGIGRFFRAWVTTENGVTWLMAKAYLLNDDEDAAEMITKLNGGVASFVSVGFYSPERVMVQDATGNTYGEYRNGPNGEEAEAIEASLVFLGAQYDAAVVKKVTDRLMAARAKAHKGGERSLVMRMLEAVGLVSKQGRVLSEANLIALRQAVTLSDQADALVERVIAAAVPVEPGKATEDAQAAIAAQEAEALAKAKANTNDKGEDEMTTEQVAALKAEMVAVVKSMIDETVAAVKAEIDAKVAEVVAKVTAVETEKVDAIDESVNAFIEDTNELAAKLVDRIENIEAHLGAPKAAAGEGEGEGEGKPDGKQRKAAQGGTFGKLIVPAELRG